MWHNGYNPECWEEDRQYDPEYWEDQMYSHEQCCKTCKYFFRGNCRIAGEYDMPSPDGSDCCDNWEERQQRRDGRW